MKKIKIGFLPLYIKLYDDCGFVVRPRTEPFYEKLAESFEEEGFEVVRSPFCSIKSEFEEAVSKFENEGCDVIVTWHAAYSPSLESIDVLAATPLPIVVLDTTETYDFSSLQDPGEMNYCHGIHGVMDLTNMLRRRGKPYAIAAGHFPTENVIERASLYVRAAAGAASLKGTKVGTIGGSFDGMGDFLISDEELKEVFGVEAVYADGDELRALRESVTDDEIEKEIAYDAEHYDAIDEIDEECHRKTARNCLAVRRWIEKHDLAAFTVNFREIRPSCGLEIMPFMEACKAMARGIGYAGEGDVLTAAITGALMRGFGDATFVEIFCPDWKGDTLYLSHMGEFNPKLIEGRGEMKKISFIFGEADDPVVSYGCYKAGSAIFTNVFKDQDGKYTMLISPVKMEYNFDDNFVGSVRGWMRPPINLGEFLEDISLCGVTHHSSLIYGAHIHNVKFFAECLGLRTVVIDAD
ncbi:MAG: hypothetical protein IJQ80_04810 [Clostridia bacterium]|nr:hypothetical protein [Clostridia bacterium]